MTALIGILTGSTSDMPVIESGIKILNDLNVPHEVNVLSAHRAPDQVAEYAASAQSRGLEVIIAAAGLAAHLPGVVAAKTCLPVLGVPMPAEPLNGFDSLLSIVQMPKGVPVGTFAIGKPGMINAALFATNILGVKYPEYREAIEKFRHQQTMDAIRVAEPAV